MVEYQNSLFLIFDLVFTSSIFLSLISAVILRFTLDVRVREALPPDKIYDSPLDWNFGFMRAMGFGYVVAFHFFRFKAMKTYYNDFDVRGFSTFFEKIVSYIFSLGVLVFVFCLVFYYSTDFFNLIEWHYSD